MLGKFARKERQNVTRKTQKISFWTTGFNNSVKMLLEHQQYLFPFVSLRYTTWQTN